MYIEPNTNIKFYSGIPLDNTYTNTLYFDTVEAQNSYFHGTLPKYTVTKQSYQRVNKGIMRVEIQAENLYDCNYLAFQNTNFGAKWFYCFITSVEYVNNITSEVTFEIDVIQTYMFNVTYKKCFIERQHSTSDSIGSNIIKEPVPLGEYITDSSATIEDTHNSYTLVVATAFDQIYDEESGTYEIVPAEGRMYGNVYSGIKYWEFTGATAVDDCNMFLQRIVIKNLTDGILSVFQVPTFIWGRMSEEERTPYLTISDINSRYKSSFSGYTNVRNKKLFTYPYNVCYVSDIVGTQFSLLKPELLGSSIDFYIDVSATPNPSAIVYPYNYNGVNNNLESGVTLNGYPQCSYAIDSYRAWLASGGELRTALGYASGITKTVSGGALTVGGASSTVGIGMVTSGLNDILETATSQALASILPPKSNGLTSCEPAIAQRHYGIRIERRHCRPQYLKIIDDFFTMYGYAQEKIDTPNFHARQRWTYIKTNNCTIVGSCPSDDIRKLCNIHNNGITYWVNASEVGNYDLSNGTL